MKRILLITLAALLPVTAGCASMGKKTGQGALLGAAIGAGSGMIVGHQSGDRGPGGVIGGALGALTGGLIGSALDEADAENEARAIEAESAVRRVRRAQGRLSLLDVIRLSQAGVSDAVIIAKLDESRAKFDLSASEIIDLKRSSVSERVIQHMLRGGHGRRVATTTTPRRVRRVETATYRTSYPPVPIHLGVGYTYHHR